MSTYPDDAMRFLRDEKRVYYLTFTQDHDRKLAIKTFVEKIGKQPEKNLC
jgi:hypothetical protein